MPQVPEALHAGLGAPCSPHYPAGLGVWAAGEAAWGQVVVGLGSASAELWREDRLQLDRRRRARDAVAASGARSAGRGGAGGRGGSAPFQFELVTPSVPERRPPPAAARLPAAACSSRGPRRWGEGWGEWN